MVDADEDKEAFKAQLVGLLDSLAFTRIKK